MSDELPSLIEERIRNIGDEELRFRGWTRDGMRQSYLKRMDADKRSPQVGDLAPDFELELLGPAGQRTGERVRLSSLRGRPVGLILGSYT